MVNLLLLGVASIFLAPLPSSAASHGLEKRQDCAASYTQCTPSGASSTSVPDISSGLSSLYVDLLDSINGITARKREAVEDIDRLLAPRSSSGLCCMHAGLMGSSACANGYIGEDGTACLLLQGYKIPFCYVGTS